MNDTEAERHGYDRLRFGFAMRLPALVCNGAEDPASLCLKMILSFHGMPQLTPTSSRNGGGPSAQDGLAMLAEEATRAGLVPRQLNASTSDLKRMQLPCVILTGGNHYAVLAKVGLFNATMHDPVTGVRSIRLNELELEGELRVLELLPSWRFAQRNAPRRLKWSDILGKVSGLKRSLALISSMALAIELISMLGPLQMQWTTDHALASGDRDLVLLLTISFLLLLLLRVAIESARSWAMLTLTTKFSLQWMTNVTRHLFHLPIGYFEKRHIGDTLSRVAVIQTIENTLTTGFLEALIDGVMALVTFVVILVYSPLLSLVGLSCGLIYFCVRAALQAAVSRQNGANIAQAALQQTYFLETLRGMQSVKSLGMTEGRVQRWLDITVSQKNAALRIAQFKAVFRSLRLGLFGVAHVVLVGLAAKAVLNSELSVGMLISLVFYQDQFIRRLAGFIDRIFDLRLLDLLAGRLSDIVLTRTEPDMQPLVHSGGAPLSFVLQAKNIKFRYSERGRLVLDKLSLRLSEGEFVVIKGGPACGKSTLLRVLIGLMPFSGDIELGGVGHKRMGWQRYRTLVHGVLDAEALLAGTVAENIACFSSEARMEQVITCAKLAGIHDEIMQMELNYETEVMHSGSSLSGSQLQRILLARALYGEPKVLLLDEALSQVPAAMEIEILSAIKRQGVSCVAVSGRSDLSTLADRCHWMRGGALVVSDDDGQAAQGAKLIRSRPHLAAREGKPVNREGL